MIESSLTLSQDCLEYCEQAKQLWIGFSGGLDSTVLLHLLASESLIAPKLIAIHINHGLSEHACNWEAHCQQVCGQIGVPLIVKHAQLDSRSNLEEAARLARYALFRSLVNQGDCLLLAHHQDDQAETLLLQLCRGAGVEGLSSMAPIKQWGEASLLRPFLAYPKQTLETYAKAHDITWVEDDSNKDSALSRNFLRHQVLPLLQTRWPKVLKNMARTASHCAHAASLSQDLAVKDYPGLQKRTDTLSIEPLRYLNLPRLANVLRVWFKINHVRSPDTITYMHLIHEMIGARQDANPCVAWDIYRVRRYKNTLYLFTTSEVEVKPIDLEWSNFPESLVLSATLGCLQAIPALQGLLIPPEGKISIRFRQGGEQFIWHSQTKSLKKLFQEWQIPTWMRERVPLLYINETLAVVVGYAVSDLFYTAHSSQAWNVLALPEFAW